jgi:hypothetical protein
MKSLSFSGMLKGDVISKKMNEAMAQMSFANEGSRIVDQDHSGKKMESTLALVKSIRLQSPGNHTGLVIAFSSIACEVPLPSDVGISFSWFRISEGQKLAAVPVEKPTSSLYLPTIDDVGYNICAQVEDEFGLGLSRHIEVLPSVVFVDPRCYLTHRCNTFYPFYRTLYFRPSSMLEISCDLY